MSFFTLTKKADYGLVLVSELAKAGRNVIVSTKMLAENKKLPKPFLASIGKDLAGAKIIGSKEGKNGGYFLKSDPRKLKVVDVIEAVEGKIRPVTCLSEDHGCPVEEACTQKNFMTKMALEMQGVISRYTVIDLISK